MTKPTRGQEQACDLIAGALVSITLAARLDGSKAFGPAELRGLMVTLARASSAYEAETIVARALERRGRTLGLRSGTSELLTLLDNALSPIDALLLSDDDFRARVEAVEQELGEVR
jgi:hypothetical protein